MQSICFAFDFSSVFGAATPANRVRPLFALYRLCQCEWDRFSVLIFRTNTRQTSQTAIYFFARHNHMCAKLQSYGLHCEHTKKRDKNVCVFVISNGIIWYKMREPEMNEWNDGVPQYESPRVWANGIKIVDNCFPFIVFFILLALAQTHLNINKLFSLVAVRDEMFVCAFLWLMRLDDFFLWLFHLFARATETAMTMIWQQNVSVSHYFRGKLFFFFHSVGCVYHKDEISLHRERVIDQNIRNGRYRMSSIFGVYKLLILSHNWKWKISRCTSIMRLLAISCCLLHFGQNIVCSFARMFHPPQNDNET